MMDWTPDRIATLRTMWGRRARVADIADALKVTRNAVIGKARRLGLARRQTPRYSGSPFWKKNTPILCRLWKAGMSSPEIANELGTTHLAVKSKIERLHLWGAR